MPKSVTGSLVRGMSDWQVPLLDNEDCSLTASALCLPRRFLSTVFVLWSGHAFNVLLLLSVLVVSVSCSAGMGRGGARGCRTVPCDGFVLPAYGALLNSVQVEFRIVCMKQTIAPINRVLRGVPRAIWSPLVLPAMERD